MPRPKVIGGGADAACNPTKASAEAAVSGETAVLGRAGVLEWAAESQ